MKDEELAEIADKARLDRSGVQDVSEAMDDKTLAYMQKFWADAEISWIESSGPSPRWAKVEVCTPSFVDSRLECVTDDVRALVDEVKRLRALELRWTTERPTTTGFYWAEFDDADEVRREILQVLEWGGELQAKICTYDIPLRLEDVLLWSGPLPEPAL